MVRVCVKEKERDGNRWKHNIDVAANRMEPERVKCQNPSKPKFTFPVWVDVS